MQPFNPLFSEDEVEYLREALEAGEGRPATKTTHYDAIVEVAPQLGSLY